MFLPTLDLVAAFVGPSLVAIDFGLSDHSASLCIKCWTMGPDRASHPAVGQAPKQDPLVDEETALLTGTIEAERTGWCDAHPWVHPEWGEMVVRCQGEGEQVYYVKRGRHGGEVSAKISRPL